MRKKSKKNYKKNIYNLVNFKVNNKFIFITILTIFFVGVLFGSIYGTAIEQDTSESILRKINNLHLELNDINYFKVFLNSFLTTFLIFFTIWFLGLTLIGIPFIYIINFLFGFVYGITITFFMKTYGLTGIPQSFLYTFPQNIVILPFVLYLSYVSIHISIKVYTKVFGQTKSKYLNKNIRKYIHLLIYAIIVTLIYCVFLITLGPIILKIALK